VHRGYPDCLYRHHRCEISLGVHRQACSPKHSFAKINPIIQDFDPILESTCEAVMLRSARDGQEQVRYTGLADVPSQSPSGDPAWVSARTRWGDAWQF